MDFPGFNIILTDSSTFYEVFGFFEDLDLNLFLGEGEPLDLET